MDVITDAQLDAWAADPNHKGHRNSVTYLRPLTPEQRKTAYWEAMTRQNFVGGTFSGNVCAAALDVAAGRTPYGDMADQMREAEKAARI